MATEPQTAFFSYSRDDSEFALRLAGDLKAAGANVWLDQLDIAPGQRWARAVQDALNNCQRLLLILSPSSVSSTNVEDEVAFALEEHKTVIPVFYRDCKVPFQLRPLQYVDFRTDYDRGLKALLGTLGAEPQAAAAGGAAPSAAPKDTAAHVPDADERGRAAEQARMEEQERERKAAEEKPPPFLSKKMMIGLAAGVVVLLMVWILWRQRSNNQASPPQTSEQRQPQTTAPQTQEQTAKGASSQSRPLSEDAIRLCLRWQLTSSEIEERVRALGIEFVMSPDIEREMRGEGASDSLILLLKRKSVNGGNGQQPQPSAADLKEPVANNCPEGVYCDPHTNLMWTIEDNGKNISWPEAEEYCKSLTLAGLSPWELPTIDELAKLYDSQNTNKYKIRKPFRLTAYWVWSSTRLGSGNAWDFSFGGGVRVLAVTSDPGGNRALCVRRSGK